MFPVEYKLGFCFLQVQMRHFKMLSNFSANVCLACIDGIGHVSLPDYDPAVGGVASGFGNWATSWLCITLPSYGSGTIAIRKTWVMWPYLAEVQQRKMHSPAPGEKRGKWLVEGESSQMACLLPHQRKENYILLIDSLQGMSTVYYLHWYFSIQQKNLVY